ncbi:hypothetical protein [Ferrovum myxofaciens]|uniref:hypothetical protein n=1 Tax=Ferrovum myxofaciens TaxID=416213 RepID=UPI002353BC3C|nr:hypothetical protein [Ferrovum myxofaciens]MBU6993708.1 hypothetical protein [Ferrovum myxofaciens]
MNRLLLTPFGLKWNPFNTELPTEALYLSPKINDFFWRIEQVHVREGGFALIQGDPGTGKSIVDPEIKTVVYAVRCHKG